MMNQDNHTLTNQDNTRTREHLANERTFLAWIRTSIALMGFGFVIVKFGLYLEHLAVLTGNTMNFPNEIYSPVIGIVMIAIGILLALIAFYQYKITEKQINLSVFKSSSMLSALITIILFTGGLFLLYQLIISL